MKTFSVMLAYCLLSAPDMFAQFRDDFSDGDLTTLPLWQGMTEDFIVNQSQQLQLDGSMAGTSWVSTAFSPAAMTDVSWEFWIKQSFAPSGGNFGRIYLLTDRSELTSQLNGYYLQLGEAGSGDAIELFRQSGDTRVSVCRAKSGGIAASFEIRAKVMRNASGQWQLWVDYSGGFDFTMEAEGNDATHKSGSFFGISCTYTISNAAGFYLDDVSIETSLAPDKSPPEIDSIHVASASALRLVFSEKLDTASISLINFNVEPRYGHPQAVRLDADGMTVVLTFADAFDNGYSGTLIATGVRDTAGNEMNPVEIEFRYFLPKPVYFNDVIITEIYADPIPQVNLPAQEFVEVLNRSPNPVQLQGWRFSDGPSTGRFPEFLLMPGDYAIVCSSPAFSEYSAIGPAVSLSNFPTLNNDGDRLLLCDSTGNPIDSVHYAADWYNDGDKAAGGWTLERIDPDDLCRKQDNWTGSSDERGGTPGAQNSAYASRPDNMGPKIISIAAAAPTILEIIFDEQIENVVPTPDQFTINPHLQIQSVAFTDGSLESLTLLLADEMQSGNRYSLKVTDLYDCPGNRIDDAFAGGSFVLPQRAIAGDIIINEILFDPGAMGVDFLEIHNRSNRTIDLKGWSIRNSQSLAGKNITIIESGHSLITPDEYRVFTEDAMVLKGAYSRGRENCFFEVNLPGFNDDEGSAVLLDDAGTVIDSMYYTREMHSPFLKDYAGVSLERISPAGKSDEAANWASAASDAEFATPGYVNSNLRADFAISNDAVVVEPEVIEPDGARPFAQIKYRFQHGGFVANVKIFDYEGRIIRGIAANELLGTEGFFRWDGETDNGSRVRMGYYFVWFEIFSAGGTVKTYKKRVAVY